MTRNSINTVLRCVALIGNAAYILWITYNGIDEGFKATLVQKISYIGILTVLTLNIILLYRKK